MHTANKKDPVATVSEVVKKEFERVVAERDEAVASYDRLKEHLAAVVSRMKKAEAANLLLKENNEDLFGQVKVLQQQIQTALKERDTQERA